MADRKGWQPVLLCGGKYIFILNISQYHYRHIIYIYFCTLCKQFTSRSCSQCCTRLFHEQQDEKYFFLYSLKEEPIRVSISPCWFKLYSSQLQAIRVEWGNLTMSCTQLLLGKFRTQKQSWRVAVVFLWNATLKLAEAIILTMF